MPHATAGRPCGPIREAGGAGQYEFFRAVGRAKASLAGKQTRPSDGRSGMVALRRTGKHEPVRGKGEVLQVIHEESQAMHQDHGATARRRCSRW